MENITFYELENQIYKIVCEFGCEILKQILESQDKKIMETRNKKEYRHKGYRTNTIKTIMGEVSYQRAIYLKDEKHIFLLDSQIDINTVGKFSYNMAEKMITAVVNSTSYRKAAKEVESLTNEISSHEALRTLVYRMGEIIENKEDEQVKLFKKEKLMKGNRKIEVLFEEADGLWVHLQGKDRKEQIERYIKKCEKQGKEFKKLHSVKSELKLDMTYTGWKDSDRHELVDKIYTTGFMTPQKLQKIRNAKLYQIYDIDSIKIRCQNGDGAKWIRNIATKDTIIQKDDFHIRQEIIRDVKEKEHQDMLIQLLNEKRYDEIPTYIENLKNISGGEEKVIKKLNTLKSYLKEGLPRYKDILKEKGIELPEPPKRIVYREMGTMESQIFTVLSNHLNTGRKSFSKKGATYLSKICAYYIENKEINLEKAEEKIEIDNSVQEWINEIEENIKKNKKMHRADRKETEQYNYAQSTVIMTREMKEILKLAEPSALMYR